MTTCRTIGAAALSVFLGLQGLLGAPALAADASPEAARRAEKLAVETCSACHGPGGRSISPTFPNLAAQNKDYLIAQLTAFREHTRGEQAAHDFMYGMARGLDDSTIVALAEFFSAQKPAAGRPGGPAMVAPAPGTSCDVLRLRGGGRSSLNATSSPAPPAMVPPHWARRSFRAWPASTTITSSSNCW